MRLFKLFVLPFRVRMNLHLICIVVQQNASVKVLLASIWYFSQGNPTLIYISVFFKFDVQHQTRQSRQYCLPLSHLRPFLASPCLIDDLKEYAKLSLSY